MHNLQQLTLPALKDLDNGKADAAFQHHLARAAEDCFDRPADKSARKITLERVTQLAVATVGAKLAAGLAEGIPSYNGRP